MAALPRRVFIAHLPAGYLVAQPLDRGVASRRAIVAASMLGSVFPDIDLIRCYVVDHGHVGHHSYWTHIPFYWALGTLAVFAFLREPRLRAISFAFLLGVFSHLVLDSVAAGIEWQFPYDDRYYGLFYVPRAYAWWPMNFFFHWTFLFEISICAAAAFIAMRVWRKDSRRVSPAVAKAPIVIDPSRRYSDLLVIRGDGRDQSPAGIRLRPR